MYLSKRKNGYYFVQYLDPSSNQTRRISTGTKSKSEALQFIKNFNPASIKINKQIKVTNFRDEYLNYVTDNKSKKYINSIELSFRQLILCVKDAPLRNLDARVMDQFISKKFSEAPSAALHYFRTLKAAFSKAVVWSYIDENPLKKTRPPKQKKSFPCFLSKSDLELIISRIQI